MTILEIFLSFFQAAILVPLTILVIGVGLCIGFMIVAIPLAILMAILKGLGFKE